MVNKRIYYAVHQVGLRPDNDPGGSYVALHGVQSVGMTTNFNLEQVFELGQLAIYENIEEIPDVEISLTKVLDGYIPMYCLATGWDATTPTLAGRSNSKTFFGLNIFDDTLTSATGTADSVVECSGMFVGSISYTFPLDDNFTEDITLVGNDKVWLNDPNILPASNTPVPTFTDGQFTTLDAPVGLGGVNRRENLILEGNGEGTDANGMANNVDLTVLPPDVFGISSSGTNEKTGDDFNAHLASITVSCDLGREQINELGRKGPYHRTVTFPIEVTCDIEVTSHSGDMVSATEGGIRTTDPADQCSSAGNLQDRTIRIATCEGTRIYLGLKNKLSSVNYTGGDAGGGNVNVTYTFTTFNDFTVMHTGENNSNFSGNDLTSRQTYLRD